MKTLAAAEHIMLACCKGPTGLDQDLIRLLVRLLLDELHHLCSRQVRVSIIA